MYVVPVSMTYARIVHVINRMAEMESSKLFLFRLAPNMANQLTFLIVVNGPDQGIVPLNLWQKPHMQSELG